MRLLIVTPQNVYATKRLREEIEQKYIAADFLDVHTLAARKFLIDFSEYSVLYIRQIYPYFKEMEIFAQSAARQGVRIVDANLSTGSIDVSKWVLYKKLSGEGVHIPSTSLLPMTGHVERIRQYPFILKWVYGFGARHVFLVPNAEIFHQVIFNYPNDQLMVQEYIPARYEYKVITVGFKSLPVIARHPINPNTKVADLLAGESLSSSNIPLVAHLAEKASGAVGRELASCDILEDRDENLYVVDVNRSPGLEPFERVTKYNAARDFIDYLIR